MLLIFLSGSRANEDYIIANDIKSTIPWVYQSDNVESVKMTS